MSEVVTVALADSAEAEEEGNARIAADAFQSQAPIYLQPAAYSVDVEYDKGDYVTDEGGIYRSQADENEGHTPHTDETFDHWAPANVSIVLLQNPAFLTGPALIPPGTPIP